MPAGLLHGTCVGEDAGARNTVFSRVKWLQPAMKGSSCVRRLRTVCSPHLCVGLLFLILYPARLLLILLRRFVTHHLSHKTLSHTTFSHPIFPLQLAHTHTQLCHTQLRHTPSFTHNRHAPSFTHNFVTHHFLTPYLSHTTCSHTHAIFHTQLRNTPSFTYTHTPSFTHNFVAHHLDTIFAWQAWHFRVPRPFAWQA